MQVFTPLKAIRKNCLDCSGGSAKSVAYCPCDGVHSTRCHLWPYRFGFRPENVDPPKFVKPGTLPCPNVNLDDLPVPRVTRKSKRSLSPERRRANVERLRRAQQARSGSKAERVTTGAGRAPAGEHVG